MGDIMTSIRDTVHAAHCCLKHGCKYADEDCPVYSGKIDQKYPCEFCREEEKPDYSVKPPDIGWTLPKPPEPPPKRIIKEDINKNFFKGFLWAFLIIILLHIGAAYVLLF